MAAGDTTLFAIDKLTCPYTEVKWYVNDSLQISAAADSFVFVASDTGISEVRVAILDTTPMLRRDPPPLLASGSQHTWTVTVDVWAGLIADQIDTSFDMIVSRVAPTPFSASVRIAFWLFGDEAVCADIYDIKGKLVAPVLKKMLGKGHHVLTWKARDSHGNAVPPGIYFCRLQAGATVSTSKVVLVR
jgi:hypothetical protein